MRGCVVGIKKKKQEKPEPEFMEETEDKNPLDYIALAEDDDQPNAEIKKLKADLSMQRAIINQLEETNNFYKKHAESLEKQLETMRKEIQLLKANQTPSTITPVSSNPPETEDEQPKTKPLAKKSIFLQLVEDAEEVTPKKSKKDKKIEEAVKEVETDLIDFLDV
jgi:small-conductance mechanosensitive channel